MKCAYRNHWHFLRCAPSRTRRGRWRGSTSVICVRRRRRWCARSASRWWRRSRPTSGTGRHYSGGYKVAILKVVRSVCDRIGRTSGGGCFARTLHQRRLRSLLKLLAKVQEIAHATGSVRRYHARVPETLLSLCACAETVTFRTRGRGVPTPAAGNRQGEVNRA